MKTRTLARIIRAIKRDCKTSGVYMNHAGETCAVGELALLAGVPKATVIEGLNRGITTGVSDVSSWCHDDKKEQMAANRAVIRMRKAIKATLGLTTDQLQRIQSANDGNSTVEERREAILAYLQMEYPDLYDAAERATRPKASRTKRRARLQP